MASLPLSIRTGMNARLISERAIDRIPEDMLGVGEWTFVATRQLADRLVSAVGTRQAYRVSNAVRAMTFVPSTAQISAVLESVRAAMVDAAAQQRDGESLAELEELFAVAKDALDSAEVSERAPASAGSLEAVVQPLVQLIALRDRESAEHLEAVGALAQRIAEQLGLDSATTRRTAIAGKLHDIGDMKPAGDAPAKRGVRAEPEAERLQRHVRDGEHFLSTIPQLAHLAPIVRSHHERYDGTGFPDGLSGDEIPIESRIIAVADALHDRMTPAHGQTALTPHEALTRVASEAGREFDPAVTAAAATVLGVARKRRRSA